MDEEIAREKKNARKRAARTSKTEDREQMEFVTWARENCELIWHTPNARKYSRASWAYWNAMGVQAGIPDILMVYRGVRWALEFKRPGEKLTDEQEAVLGILRVQGWRVAVVESCEDAKKFVREDHQCTWVKYDYGNMRVCSECKAKDRYTVSHDGRGWVPAGRAI